MTEEANGNAPDFQKYKGVVHLKHTGTELIADILGISEETRSITLKNPTMLQAVGVEEGKSQMALMPFLMTTKDDTIHLALADILFIGECRTDVAEQHTQMFSSVILPKNSSKIIT